MTHDVEHRAVLVLRRRWRFGIPVSYVAFRGYDALDDPVGRSRPMATDAEGAAPSVRVSDSQDRIPIGPLIRVANVVDQARRLEIREFPARKPCHSVGAASRAAVAGANPGLGQEILNAIERQGYAVLGRRPVISKPRKLALVARAALHKLI